MTTNDTSAVISAREVVGSKRLQVLARHFGRQMIAVENVIYAFMRQLARDYNGGFWHYFELSNGGFYMAPSSDERFVIGVDTNGYEGSMSADAAGITACLFTLSHLSFQIQKGSIAEHFHLLRDFAPGHPEASAILASID